MSDFLPAEVYIADPANAQEHGKPISSPVPRSYLGKPFPALHRYILATPEALLASPEVQALIQEAVKAERERCALLADPPLWKRKGKPGLWRTRRAAIAVAIRDGKGGV